MSKEKRSMSMDDVETLHELLRLAIDDLKLCYADPDVEVGMDEWLAYDAVKNVCEVCLAGALVLKGTHMASAVPTAEAVAAGTAWSHQLIDPGDDVRPWMRALDYIRMGQLGLALDAMTEHLEESGIDQVPGHWKEASIQALAEWRDEKFLRDTLGDYYSPGEMINRLEKRYELLKRHNL